MREVHGKGSLFTRALELDKILGQRYSRTEIWAPGYYQMDNRWHSFCGHNAEDTYALNFILPVFIECGLPVTQQELLGVQQGNLHQLEYKYLKRCMEVPRPLSTLCRQTLRNHLKGRKIHDYVMVVRLPKSLKDFILLKHVLLLVAEN